MSAFTNSYERVGPSILEIEPPSNLSAITGKWKCLGNTAIQPQSAKKLQTGSLMVWVSPAKQLPLNSL